MITWQAQPSNFITNLVRSANYTSLIRPTRYCVPRAENGWQKIVMLNEIFLSAICPDGNLAGVFEYDGESGYFYLYVTKGVSGRKIAASIHMVSGQIDFVRDDIAIQWDRSGKKVALFIKNEMWAIFDSVTGQKFGGAYHSHTAPAIPDDIVFVSP